MFNNEKDRYLLQPYFVGGESKSMAVILPARVRKIMQIDASAAFELRWDKENRKITLEVI
ncbi:MAG: hypothetical protein ACRD8W_05890 [Nitrososphaeraceae archaeon]